MTTENKINKLVKISTTEFLILKLKETLGNNKLASLCIAIVGELENRIGEDAVDNIIMAN